jgi:hypothetical protein
MSEKIWFVMIRIGLIEQERLVGSEAVVVEISGEKVIIN